MKENEIIVLQNGLTARRSKDLILLEWKRHCTFHDIAVESLICAGIDRHSALRLLQALQESGSADTLNQDLSLRKTKDELSISYKKTFLEPKTITLSPDAETTLAHLLQDLINNPELSLSSSTRK